MTAKLIAYIERVRKRALAEIGSVQRLQAEEARLPPKAGRSMADTVRGIDIGTEIEHRMSGLGSLLALNFCTSMKLKALKLELREASKIRRPTPKRVADLRQRVDAVMSGHIADLRARDDIRDMAAELRESDAIEATGDPRSKFAAHHHWTPCATGWFLRKNHWTYVLKLETDGIWSGIIKPLGQKGIFVGRFSRSLRGSRGALFDAAQRIRQN